MATIRKNKEQTAVEVVTDDGVEWGPIAWPDDQIAVLADDGKEPHLVVLDGYEGLQANTVYKLVPVATLIEEDDFLEAEDDGDDDDDGEPE